jgi:hypothetical protein
MTKVNGILIIYHHQLTANAPTIMEHVNAFGNYSSFKVWNVNTALGFPSALKNFRFDIIVLHYSLFGLPINLNEEFLRFLAMSEKSYKIAFLQDEHRYWPERSKFINSYGIDRVYTLLEQEYFEDTYLRHTSVSKLVPNLPGYASQEMVTGAQHHCKPDRERTIDIGYRGRRLPYYMGRGSQEKHLIGVEFKQRAAPLGLRVDIETDENKRIYGRAWLRFLGNCRAVLGVETGVSVFDINNTVRPQYAKICKGHPDTSYPDCNFKEFHDTVLAPHEDRIFYRTIGPRHFEAAAFRTCQILFEGKYSGILKPMVHYIPLKKDFSNFEEVIRAFRNDDLRREMTENCYRDLIESGKYSYERFIKGFDEEMLSQGFSPEMEKADAQNVTELLNRDKLQRYVRVRLARIRHRDFPGRNVLRPVIKPLLKYLGI